MSRINRIALLILAAGFLLGWAGGCVSQADHDALKAEVSSLKDSLRAYVIDGRPGDPLGTPPIPPIMSLDEWLNRVWEATCQLEQSVYDDLDPSIRPTPTNVALRLCPPPGEGDPPGRPPKPPPL